MTRRQELYAKVKELNAASAIQTRYGDNYTRVSNADLEDFLRGFGKKKEAPKKQASAKAEVKDVNKAFIQLLTTLQVKKVITAKEAKEVAEML